MNGSQHDFIERQLNKIALAGECLDYVMIYQDIDTLFSRLYIRFYVEVVMKDNHGFLYHDNDEFKSYSLWGKSGEYRYYEYDDWDLYRNFTEVFQRCDDDIRKFVELVMLRFPKVNIYNFTSRFTFVDRELYQERFNTVVYIGESDGYFEEKYLTPPDELVAKQEKNLHKLKAKQKEINATYQKTSKIKHKHTEWLKQERLKQRKKIEETVISEKEFADMVTNNEKNNRFTSDDKNLIG